MSRGVLPCSPLWSTCAPSANSCRCTARAVRGQVVPPLTIREAVSKARLLPSLLLV
jgi:hypothetical protein